MIGWLNRFRKAAAEPAKKPTPRSPVPLAESEIAGRISTLCETYVSYPTSFEDLRHWRQMVANRHPDMGVLASLDDLQQARYTSGHCIDKHGLDDTVGHDLSHMGPERFEDGAFADYLKEPGDFPIRLANFRRQLASAERNPETRKWLDCNKEITITDVNEDPDAVTDDFGIIQAVPVTGSADMIAAYPNGYFHGDMTPFEVHDVAVQLEGLGYRLIAMGASYMAFWSEDLLSDPQIAQRSLCVAALYETPDIDALNRVLTGERHLILRYTG